MKTTLAIGAACLAAWLAGPLVPAAAAQNTRPRTATHVAVRETPYLGIGVQDIDSERAKALKLTEERGVEVTSVAPNSPAAKAGMKENDVVLEFNGEKVQGGEQLSRLVRETPVGRQVKLGVWRNGGMQTVSPTVEARRGGVFVSSDDWPGTIAIPPIPPVPPMPNIDIPRLMVLDRNARLGIEGEAMSQEPQLAEFFGVKEGVLVKAVIKDSAAEKAGIKAGDVIVKVGDAKVSTTREITATLRELRSQKTFTVVVVRNKKETPLTVTLPDTTGSVPGSVRAFLFDDSEV